MGAPRPDIMVTRIERRLAQIEAFAAANGRSPRSGGPRPEKTLRNWMYRTLKRQDLPAELRARIEKLIQMDRRQKPETVSPEERRLLASSARLSELESFVRERGRMPSTEVPEERSLYKWAWKRRRDPSMLPAELRPRLDAVVQSAQVARGMRRAAVWVDRLLHDSADQTGH